MATSLIQRHKLKIKTRATKNLSAAIQQTKCSDCLQRLDSWDGCRAHPALCYSSNIDCWNDQISRNIPEKDRLGVTKSWEYQNMLKEELNSPNCNNSLLLINNHCLTKTWPALLSHVTRDTCHGRGVTGESVTLCHWPHSWMRTDSWSWRAPDPWPSCVTGELHASAGLVADITNVLNTISAAAAGQFVLS